jgi:SagB-type dehydrogenase family enzyme
MRGVHAAAAIVMIAALFLKGETMADEAEKILKLPEPAFTSKVSVEEAMHQRRSRREYALAPLKLSEIAQLLWAAQGVTDPRGLRTAPSAGALYPLELYLVAEKVEGLEAGVYRYLSEGHALERVIKGKRRNMLYLAALAQPCVKEAPAAVVMTAVYERVTAKYGKRGERYVHMEAGHAAENLYLQAESLGLSTLVVGAFSGWGVQKAIGAAKEEEPLCILPIGKR